MSSRNRLSTYGLFESTFSLSPRAMGTTEIALTSARTAQHYTTTTTTTATTQTTRKGSTSATATTTSEYRPESSTGWHRKGEDEQEEPRCASPAPLNSLHRTRIKVRFVGRSVGLPGGHLFHTLVDLLDQKLPVQPLRRNYNHCCCG